MLNIKNAKLFSFSSLLLILFMILSSQKIYGADQYDIQIQGNTKTTAGHGRQLVRACIKQQDKQSLEAVDTNQLQRCLLNQKLFSSVKVRQEGDVLTVIVKERWSLIPIPMVSQSEGQSPKYGLFLMESNFLGLGKTLIGGWMGGDSGSHSFLVYRDPKVLGTDWTFLINYLNAGGDRYLYDGEDKVDGESFKVKSLYGEVGYQFNKHLVLGIAYIDAALKYAPLESYDTSENLNSEYMGTFFRWDASDFKFYFQEGLKVDVAIQKQFSRNDETSGAVRQVVKIDWQTNGISDLVLQTKLRLGKVDKGDQRDRMVVGDTSGFRGIPTGGAWVKKYAALAIDFQIPIQKIEEGTWTVAPFLDIGQLDYRDTSLANRSYYSTGIGTYFYLKKIAFPGVGLVYGYNNEFQSSFYKFTVGFSL